MRNVARFIGVPIGRCDAVISDLRDQALRPIGPLGGFGHGRTPASVLILPPPMATPVKNAGNLRQRGEMIDAIETLRRCRSNATAPVPAGCACRGLTSALVVAAVALFWLPVPYKIHTLKVVPQRSTHLYRDVVI